MKLKLPRIRLPSQPVIEDFIQEAALVVGFFMLMYGLWQCWQPSMWIVGGLLLMRLGTPRTPKEGR